MFTTDHLEFNKEAVSRFGQAKNRVNLNIPVHPPVAHITDVERKSGPSSDPEARKFSTHKHPAATLPNIY